MLDSFGRIADGLKGTLPEPPKPQVEAIVKVTVAICTVAEAIWGLIKGEDAK